MKFFNIECSLKSVIFVSIMVSSLLSEAQLNKFPYYQYSDTLLYYIEKDTNNKFRDYPREAATVLSFINDYNDILNIRDKGKSIVSMPSREDSIMFLNFKPYNAEEYIVSRSKNEKIIIINEAHHQPNHRVFTESLLKGLWDNGYRYFGVEGVSKSDKGLNSRKYPLCLST